MKRTLLILLSVILCASVLLTGCKKSENKTLEEKLEEQKRAEMQAYLKEHPDVVSVAEDTDITFSDYNLMYKSNYDSMLQYQTYYGEDWFNTEIDDDGTTIGEYIKTTTMESLLDMIAVEKLAKENGITVESVSENVEAERLRMIESQGGEEGYNQFLSDYKTTDEAVKKYFTRMELYNKLVEKLTAEGGKAYVSEDQMLNEFGKKYMRVQHILISFDTRSKEEALNIANTVLDELESGADFDALINKYNEDPGMTSGNYYIFTDGDMVAEFEDASKNLEVDSYTTEPVETEYGYHIIKKYAVQADCAEYESFKQSTTSEMVLKIIDDKKNSFIIETNTPALDNHLEDWLSELGVKLF